VDGTIEESERRTIRDIVEGTYGLKPDEARAPFKSAETTGRETSDLCAFAVVVKGRFAHEERVRLIEMLK
jgi:uncharacterized tellurite resistance protein B-like protein